MSTVSSSVATHLTVPQSLRTSRLYKRIASRLQRRTVRRRTVRISLLVINVAILAVIVYFVLPSTKSTTATETPPLGANILATVNPLDQLSSADIALTVARATSLPETTAIANQAQSQAADLAIISNSDNVLTKPQVVYTALKSRADIVTYVTKAGDTVAVLASQYGVTSNSILWSNGLNGNALPAGMKLLIPPINGIVYTVKTGDTAASLATKFNASQAQIIAYNDAEINGLQPGEQILIPNGSPPVATSSAFSSLSAAFPWGAGPIYGSNGYDFGFCTWYVATQVHVPSNWGNASSWAYYARLSGWSVSGNPTIGSIAQTADAAGGEGHVAMVTGVEDGGAQIHIQDMNDSGDGGGWDRVGSGWVSAAKFQNFISQ